MLQKLFVYIWVPLLLLGPPLMVLRPMLLFLRRKDPMGPRTKSFLWFFQVVGFWAFLIGACMILPNLLSPLFEKDASVEKEVDSDDDSQKRLEETKSKKNETKEAEKEKSKSD
ncbi:MAG: hypothetical protein GY822_12700 [Deltaproteobacteria bacterium]|nr:hypothetical protein [Deltaproteobacteria bacterium]